MVWKLVPSKGNGCVMNSFVVPTNLIFRINKHISPAKVGTGCLEFKLPAGGSGRPPPTPHPVQKAQLSFFSQPPYGVDLSQSGDLRSWITLCFSSVVVSGFSSGTNNAGL